MVLSELRLKLLEGTEKEVSSRDVNHNHTGSLSQQSKRKPTLLRDRIISCASSLHALKQRLPKSSSFLMTSPLSSTSVGNDSVFFSDSYHDAAHLTTGLCRDYVVYRLQRSGFGYKVIAVDFPPAKDQILSSRVLRAGRTFETLHPTLFKNLSKKLNYFFDSEQTIRRLYFRLATHILGIDCRAFTWARVLSLFCLAGAIAVDCASQGRPELINDVVKISSDFIKQNILQWVIDRGGWISMASHFTRVRSEKRDLWKFTFFKKPTLPVTTIGLVGLSILGLIGAHVFV